MPSANSRFSTRHSEVSAGVVLAVLFAATTLAATEVGPERGQLVIVGGGGEIDPILHRFVDLAGGPSAPIVVIPTASGQQAYDSFHWQARWFREEAGVEKVTVLHTLDREEADSEAFVAPIREARGVWFPGGRQWRLADSYLGTRTERELHCSRAAEPSAVRRLERRFKAPIWPVVTVPRTSP